MRITRRSLVCGLSAVMLGCVALTGCQTYPAGFGGMTLPSPHHLKHYPQYFSPPPPFPLQRELDSMQDPEGLMRAGGRTGNAALSPLPPISQPQPVPAQPAAQPAAQPGM